MIISIAGGLGNQMFQYAYYLAQKHRYPDMKVLADLSFYDASKIHNGYEINRIFGICVDECDANVSSAHRMTNTIFDRLLRKCGFYYAGFHYTLRDKAKGYDKRFVGQFAEDDYLFGFWQCEKYFSECKELVLNSFQFPPYKSDANKNIATKMNSVESIAIHVRRGDYLKNKMFVNLAEDGYYERAIAMIKKEAASSREWFVFSDDIEWCKNNLHLSGENVHYVTGNKGNDSYMDMQLMTEAKYLIIANSSFSWWGAYLNKRAKMIIAPKKFYNHNEGFNKDICPNLWKRV